MRFDVLELYKRRPYLGAHVAPTGPSCTRLSNRARQHVSCRASCSAVSSPLREAVWSSWRRACSAILGWRRWCSRSCSATAIRTVWTPEAAGKPGIGFSAKTLLEIAVVLLGASVSARRLGARADAAGRHRRRRRGRASPQATRSAARSGCRSAWRCWSRAATAICGNSAIAAVAPVIGAKPTTSHPRSRSRRCSAWWSCSACRCSVPVLGLSLHPIWHARGADRLCGAAGAGGDRADRARSAIRSAPWSSWCAC